MNTDVSVVMTPLKSRVAAVPTDGAAVGDGVGAWSWLNTHTQTHTRNQSTGNTGVNTFTCNITPGLGTRLSKEKAGIWREGGKERAGTN